MREPLEGQLKQLCLTGFAAQYLNEAERCEAQGESHIGYLASLVEQELEVRYHKRIERLLKQARLPRRKTLVSFDPKRIPGLSRSLLERLASGRFMERAENLLLFGNPGTGKSHLCLALAEEWCLQGRRVHYTTAAQLIQRLLKAKAALELNELIKKLDRYEALIIDDISYTGCDPKETDVLFTLLSERYEMRSVVITSNLPFGGWGEIFKDTMTTSAAVDRLVHHAIILELNAESYRLASAKGCQGKRESIKEQEVGAREVAGGLYSREGADSIERSVERAGKERSTKGAPKRVNGAKERNTKAKEVAKMAK